MRNTIFNFRLVISINLIILGLKLNAYKFCAFIIWLNIRKLRNINTNSKKKFLRKVLIFPKSGGNEDLIESQKYLYSQ